MATGSGSSRHTIDSVLSALSPDNHVLATGTSLPRLEASDGPQARSQVADVTS